MLHFIPYTIYYTQYTKHYALYTKLFLLYTIYYIQYIIQYTLSAIHYTINQNSLDHVKFSANFFFYCFLKDMVIMVDTLLLKTFEGLYTNIEKLVNV